MTIIMTSVGENGVDRGERHRTGGETEAARSLQVGASLSELSKKSSLIPSNPHCHCHYGMIIEYSLSERNSSGNKCLVMKQFLSADQLDEIEEIIEMKVMINKH